MRKTKIICTLGPATDKGDTLKKLIEAGMDVARMNFSHGSYEEHGGRLAKLKKLRKECNRPVAALLDTKGPEIRLKQFKDGKVSLKKGQKFTFTSREVEGTSEIASVTYKDLPEDVEVGSRILVDDGLIECVVDEITGDDIICTVKNDGQVSDNKGINVPGIKLSMKYLSEKDKKDILFGIEQDVDFIAASFVRKGDDVKKLRKLLKDNGGENIRIIAKIENKEGVENIDDIIELSDGVMIARGDMGVEIPGEEVPVIQKMIIKKVYEAGKIVITATQMLDSMMKNPRPTRAETTDVANAVYDGTSVIMLSGETAAGQYPVEALKTMTRIAECAENDIDYRKRFFHHDRKANPDITDAICHATCTTSHDLNARAIVTVTKSGRSARMISRYRPDCMILGCAMDEKVCRQLNMSWGVVPVLLEEKKDLFELFDAAVDIAKAAQILEKDDTVVITAGVPIGTSGTTNMMKVEKVD
ncbi:MAG: pyruvate kinase [Lachnospiraceae bacterium]|nr:pyruvate kinase [Lachnospiraceae bacterium]